MSEAGYPGPPEAPESTEHDPDRSAVLAWAEEAGKESMRARYATAEIVAREAQTTLTVLLAGIGGSLAYALKVFGAGPATNIEVGAALLCTYLIGVALTLVMCGMSFRSFPALSQDPLNLAQTEYSLDDMREAELRNLSERIDEAATLNKERAELLNNIRLATALSPFVFAAGAVFYPTIPAASSTTLTLECVHAPAASAPSEPASSNAIVRCTFRN